MCDEGGASLAQPLPVRYGHVHNSAEFNTKNMIDDQTGTRAIGRLLTDSLPGLYWLNLFGAPYLDLIGRERLLSAPAFEVNPVDDGVLLTLASAADAWERADYKDREQAVITHLGEEFFFSRHDPGRKTIAPDFDAWQQREMNP